MVVFDVRNDSSHAGYIAAVNHSLVSHPGNEYLLQFGCVASSDWWAAYDRGQVPVKIRSGIVTHVGCRVGLFDENEDVIEFKTEQRNIVYDRTGPWAQHPIVVGDRIQVIRTKVEIETGNGLLCYLVDLRAEWDPQDAIS